MTSPCSQASTYHKDHTYHSLVVHEKLTACSVHARTAEVGQLVANSIVSPNGSNLAGASSILTDDNKTAVPNNQGALSFMGVGGIITSTPLPNTIQIADLRNLTPYVVGTNPTDSEYTSIQDAINAASAAGGGLVLVKRGSYSGFTLTNLGVVVKGVERDAVQITTASTVQSGFLVDLFFNAKLDVTGPAGSFVYLKGCHLDGLPICLEVNFTDSNSTIVMHQCEGFNATTLIFRNGTIYARELTFTVGSLDLFSDQATNTTITAQFTSSTFVRSGLNVTNSTNVANVQFLQCNILDTLVLGYSTTTNRVNFAMIQGFVQKCSVDLLIAGSATQLHDYSCMFHGVSFFIPSLTSISDFKMNGGICTIDGCHFGVGRTLTGDTTNITATGTTGSVLQVRNCTFSIYKKSNALETHICIDNSSLSPLRLFTGGNIVQASDLYSGLLTVNPVSGGSSSDTVF